MAIDIVKSSTLIVLAKKLIRRDNEMKRLTQKAVVAGIGIALLFTLMPGCEEQGASNIESNARKHRLIVVENKQLKKQLEQSERENEEQKKLLAKCLQEKNKMEMKTQKDMENLLGGLFETLGQESERLQAENKKLKALIEALDK